MYTEIAESECLLALTAFVELLVDLTAVHMATCRRVFGRVIKKQQHKHSTWCEARIGSTHICKYDSSLMKVRWRGESLQHKSERPAAAQFLQRLEDPCNT